MSKTDRRNFECWRHAVDARLLNQYGCMSHEISGLTEDYLRQHYDGDRMSPLEFVEWFGRKRTQEARMAKNGEN